MAFYNNRAAQLPCSHEGTIKRSQIPVVYMCSCMCVIWFSNEGKQIHQLSTSALKSSNPDLWGYSSYYINLQNSQVSIKIRASAIRPRLWSKANLGWILAFLLVVWSWSSYFTSLSLIVKWGYYHLFCRMGRD